MSRLIAVAAAILAYVVGSALLTIREHFDPDRS